MDDIKKELENELRSELNGSGVNDIDRYCSDKAIYSKAIDIDDKIHEARFMRADLCEILNYTLTQDLNSIKKYKYEGQIEVSGKYIVTKKDIPSQVIRSENKKMKFKISGDYIPDVRPLKIKLILIPSENID